MILPADSLPIEHYDIGELITLRSRIDKLLPSMDNLDLQHELVLQFAGAKELLRKAQEDSTSPLNQISQVINTSTSILKVLAEAQINLYSAERNRAMEAALIDLLKDADEEDRTAFMEEYKKRLEVIK